MNELALQVGRWIQCGPVDLKAVLTLEAPPLPGNLLGSCLGFEAPQKQLGGKLQWFAFTRVSGDSESALRLRATVGHR